jgi:serine protease Do
MKCRWLLFPALLALTGAAGWAQAPTTAAPSPALASPPGTSLAASPHAKVAAPLGSIDIANEPIVRVVANVQPAVVNITAQAAPEYYNTIYDSFFRRYSPPNRAEQSIGSGMIISADGYILTNAHVVALAEQEKVVSITLNSGAKYQAKIVSADEDADLALLKIDDTTVQFPYFDLSYVSPNFLGETVVALGSPAGYRNSVSQGILSATNRTFTVEGHNYVNLLQTDAAINPGNSGGPLVDINGGLVGINSAKLAGEAIENIGFAIPNEIVVPWAKDAMAVARGLKPPSVAQVRSILDTVRDHLGFQLKTLTPDEAAAMRLEVDGGMIITQVQDQSPAFEAGLRENMVVIAIGNRQVTDEKTLPHELAHLQPGMNVRVHVIYGEVVGPVLWQRAASAMLVSR